MAGLLDFLFPSKCVACGAHGRSLCEACVAGCSFLAPPLCGRCGHPVSAERHGPTTHRCPFAWWSFGGPPAFECVRSVVAYDGVVKAAIKAFKYHRTMSVGQRLGDLIVRQLPDDWSERITVVTPVPLHPSRLRERGFNQAEFLARPVAGRLRVACRTDLLVRRRQEGAQANLDARARRFNVIGAFEASQATAGLAVLLVDDVFSTGATADACASALKRAGACSVSVLTLARAVLAGSVNHDESPV